MGLGRDDLTAINPQLIYVSFSGFGQTGPSASRRGVDALIQVETGLALAQGGLLGSLSFVAEAAGLALTGAMIASLFKRERTGEVDHIEMNLFDVGLYLQTAPILECSITGNMLDQTAHAARYPLSGIFTAADGPIYMGLYWDSDWATFCDIGGRPELSTDPRFATGPERSANLEALHEIVGQMLMTRSRREWIDALEARGVMAGEVRTHTEVLDAEQTRLSNSIEKLPTTRGEVGAFVKSPARLGGHRPDASPAPKVGQDTDEILDIIEIAPGAREDLRKRGVVS